MGTGNWTVTIGLAVLLLLGGEAGGLGLCIVWPRFAEHTLEGSRGGDCGWLSGSVTAAPQTTPSAARGLMFFVFGGVFWQLVGVVVVDIVVVDDRFIVVVQFRLFDFIPNFEGERAQIYEGGEQ